MNLPQERPAPEGLGKSRMGIPDPGSPRGVILANEARKSRHRLYPVTFVYSSVAVSILFFAARSHPTATATLATAGLAFWTLVEYLVHRYVLHGVFPATGSAWSRFLNKAFDHLHWQHHLRPWDGNHINGTIFDTVWVVAPAFALGLLAPVHTVPAFLAGFILGYVIEEWCHHSVHFYVLDWKWFRSLKARHFVHHSRLGSHILFGLSNGFWDDVVGTGLAAAEVAGPGRVEALRPAAPGPRLMRPWLRTRAESRTCGARPRIWSRRRPHGGGCTSEPRA